MIIECTDCRTKLEIQTMYAGQAHLCPICNARLTAPMPASGQTTGQPRSEVVIDSIKQSIQAGINEAGITTLPRYMADRNITGGIELITSHVEKDNQSGSDLAAQQDGRYRIGKVIEQGGMGIIFNTRDINIRRDIAMKVIGDPKAIGRNGILRFIEEAQITGQLEHPGIIPLHELCSDASGNFFYTMKLIKGRTLFNILDSIRTGDVKTIREYPLSNLLIIFQKICDAMAFSHSKMVIHRDLKPENIMIGEYGEVQVMDWGLAKILPRNKMKQVPEKTREPQSSADDTIIDSVRKDANVDIMKTMAGTIMGTLGFMAPEQARGETVNLDERTDIYGLGSILYEILTLHPPIKT
ncbi:MAG: serine/threonine-protein kinase, partial [Kiritimatiellae bacterium]|nr:serine/threonine-protein kinase [Kiritimatiellia bacterium]